MPRREGNIETDAAIIERSLADPDAFTEIFHRHYRTIRRYTVSRAGADAGADLASQVFVTAFEGRHKYRTDYTDARPWLYGIAANKLRHHFRKQRRGVHALQRVYRGRSSDVEMDHSGDVDRRLDAADLAVAVKHAIELLRPADREVLLLHAWGDLSYEEIAVSLGIPVGTVRSRLSRSRKKLRELLERNGKQ